MSSVETDRCRFLCVWSERRREREGRGSGWLAQNLRSFEGQTQCRPPVILSSGGFEPIRSLAGSLIGNLLTFFFLSLSPFSEFHNWFQHITHIFLFSLFFFNNCAYFPPHVKRWDSASCSNWCVVGVLPRLERNKNKTAAGSFSFASFFCLRIEFKGPAPSWSSVIFILDPGGAAIIPPPKKLLI